QEIRRQWSCCRVCRVGGRSTPDVLLDTHVAAAAGRDRDGVAVAGGAAPAPWSTGGRPALELFWAGATILRRRLSAGPGEGGNGHGGGGPKDDGQRGPCLARGRALRRRRRHRAGPAPHLAIEARRPHSGSRSVSTPSLRRLQAVATTHRRDAPSPQRDRS